MRALMGGDGPAHPERPKSEWLKGVVLLTNSHLTTVSSQYIVNHCKETPALDAAPKKVEFRDSLPMTASQKHLKKMLRDEEMARQSE